MSVNNGLSYGEDIALYLVDRMKSGKGGLSAKALIVAAFSHDAPTDVPSDIDDLGRCCLAFYDAPWDLKKQMLPILTEWFAMIQEKVEAKA